MNEKLNLKIVVYFQKLLPLFLPTIKLGWKYFGVGGQRHGMLHKCI